MNQRRWIGAVAVVVAVAAATTTWAVTRDGEEKAVAAGPLHSFAELTMTTVTVPKERTGYTWTAVVSGRLDVLKPLHVKRVRLIPVPGHPTPKLLESGWMTVGAYGSDYGRPAAYRHIPLLGQEITPKRNAVGIMLVLSAGHKPGFYAVAGVELDYRIEGEDYQARVYTGIGACVPNPDEQKCPDRQTDALFDDVTRVASG